MDGKVVLSSLCIRQNPPPQQPTTFTLLAAAVATASHCYSRCSPFFGALNYRPELQNSKLERVARTRIDGTRPHMLLGGTRSGDGRKFATSSLMLLKQKTPAPTHPVRVAFRAPPAASRRRTDLPSFLPSFLPPFVPCILSPTVPPAPS